MQDTNKIPVGVLGATGMVGQNYIRLLENHPWFEIAYLAASENSAGKKYKDAVEGRWQMASKIPEHIKEIEVKDAANTEEASKNCRLVFSAFEMNNKEETKNLENKYAESGVAVVSNSSAHRGSKDVPVIIPEINPRHLGIIPLQQKNRGWEKGFIIVKPNCSLQSYLAPIYALMKAGYEIKKIIITTLQAVSGAGYPGVPSIDMLGNVIPFIKGEEEKTEREPLKILGDIKNGEFADFEGMEISAHCNRVPVIDGHLACASFLLGDKKPREDEIIKIWREFRSLPQELCLPSAPALPIIYMEEDNRPQPAKDRDAGKGMAVSVGRLRKCNVFDYKFAALSHNTVRGAAGGGILNAELAVKQGYVR